MTVNVLEAWSAGAPRPLVEAAWSNPCAAPALVIPDGGWDIVAAPAQGTLHLVGVMTAPRLVTGRSGAPFIGLRFRAGAMKALLGIAASELRDQVVPLKAVAPRLAEAIEREGLTLAALLRAVRGVWGREPGALATDLRLRRALAVLAGTTPGDDGACVARAAAAVGLSRRQLERLFLEHVGTSPKFHQRVMRLHAALRSLQVQRGLAAAASIGGYADQAHFTREMRALTGRVPSAVQALVAPAVPDVLR
jgi:AraC-like DNA-binding protein